jgi:choline dehydrogenase
VSNAAPDRDTYDYVVVGAGSSGCVVASRLSRTASVLLIEAGGLDTAPDVGELIAQPRHALRAVADARLGVPYATVPQPGLGGRATWIHRGVVRGGCSAVNGMVYVRGNRRDYDRWAALGNAGWSYSDVLPAFTRSERWAGGASPYHGTDGPLDVRLVPDPTPVARAFVQAAAETGFRDSALEWDFNGARQEEAAGLYQMTVTPEGRRASAASAFLGPAARPGALTVKTGVRARRVVLERDRAVAVQGVEAGAPVTYRAEREVVLSAGAFESPKLLLLSGIGPAAHLSAVGLRTLADLPGVGQNLHDHLMIPIYHQATGAPGRSAFIAEAGLFARTHPSPDDLAPDLQYHALGAMPCFGVDPAETPNFVLCPALVKPASRGSLRLASSRPEDAPVIDPAYLREPSDVEVLAAGIELARELAAAPALRPFCAGASPFAVPNPFDLTAWLGVPARGAALRAFVRAAAATVWHPVGTCRMGTDPLAVVDPALRVHGVQGLRVADASVMPVIVSGNTNAACIMIGERCAELMSRAGSPARGG